MGNVWSYIVSLMCGGISLCDQLSISGNKFVCCSGEASQSQVSMAKADALLYDDFFVAQCKLTRQFYTRANIAYFNCDVHGVATYASENMAELVGLTPERNLQSINWVANIADNNFEVYNEWAKGARNRVAVLKKMHFTFKVGKRQVHRYVVVESSPQFDSEFGDYVGLKGVVLSLPEFVWNILSDDVRNDEFQQYVAQKNAANI